MRNEPYFLHIYVTVLSGLLTGFGITNLVLPPSPVKLQRMPNDVKEAFPDLIRGIQV